MYRLFVSEGIVLGKKGVGEANVLVYILTKEFGLLRARVQSARVEHSKLRYGLEPLTLGMFTFVQGKKEWRLVGSEPKQKLTSPRSYQRQRAGQVTKLLSRLIHGEEPLPELYKTIAEGLSYLSRVEGREETDNLECVLVLRVLSHLGYLPQTPLLRPFIENDFFSLELAAEAARSRALLIRTINESLGATGL
jgi:DNA repair protein RecO (recombination protein O)